MLLQIGSFAPSAASVLLSFSPPHPRFISSVPLSGTRTLIYLQVLFMFHHSREQRTTPRRLENGSWPVFQRLYTPPPIPRHSECHRMGSRVGFCFSVVSFCGWFVFNKLNHLKWTREGMHCQNAAKHFGNSSDSEVNSDNSEINRKLWKWRSEAQISQNKSLSGFVSDQPKW